MIDCMEVFSTFTAIKLHFSGAFDVRKYGFNLKRCTGEALFKSNQEYLCRKLADRYQTSTLCRTVFAANLVRDPTLHVRNIKDDLADTLKLYNANKRALVEDIFSEIDDGLFTRVKEHDIIKDMYTGNLSLELVCFIDKLLPIGALIDSYHSSDYAWKLLYPKIDKLSPFCLLDSKGQMDEIRDLLLRKLKTKQPRGNTNEHFQP